jgi:hypothetical protein
LAYLFISDDDGLGYSNEPDSHWNAFLVQPGGRIPADLETVPLRTGPSLGRRGLEWEERVEVELSVGLSNCDPVAEGALELIIASKNDLRRGLGVEFPEVDIVYPRSYIGGQALYRPSNYVPLGAEWDFFFQIEGGEGWDEDPYLLNFGGGIGYAFLSSDSLEGRFFWDA